MNLIGRPPISPELKLTNRQIVCLSDYENELLEEAAFGKNMSISQYIREALHESLSLDYRDDTLFQWNAE